MKELLISYIKTIVVLILVTVFVSCSNNKEPELKLTKEDLIGILWEIKEFKVVKRPESNEYYPSNYSTHTCTFRKDGVFKYTGWGSTFHYEVSNEILYLDDEAFKIAKFTGDYIELISEEGLTDDIAIKSGYGFLVKYELRKI